MLPTASLVILATGRPEASVRLFAAVDGGSGHLAVSGLRPLPGGRVYRKSAAPADAATFTVDANGRAWVVVAVPAPLEETLSIILNEEPAATGSAPLGPPAPRGAHDWR